MVQNRHRVVAKHPRRVIDRGFARAPRAAVIVHDYHVILREFGHLIGFPDLAIASSLAKEDEGLALTVNFKIDFSVIRSYCRHLCLRGLRVALPLNLVASLSF